MAFIACIEQQQHKKFVVQENFNTLHIKHVKKHNYWTRNISQLNTVKELFLQKKIGCKIMKILWQQHESSKASNDECKTVYIQMFLNDIELSI